MVRRRNARKRCWPRRSGWPKRSWNNRRRGTRRCGEVECTSYSHMPAKLNVAELVDNSKLGAFQITVFILCGLCLVMDGFDVQSMGYVGPTLIPEWKIS